MPFLDRDNASSDPAILTLMEGLPLAMALLEGPGGRVMTLNRAFVDLFGYNRDLITRESDWWRLAYPDPAARLDAQQAWESQVRPSSGGDPSAPSLDTQVTCRDGSTRLVRMALTRLGTGQVISFTDRGDHRPAGEGMLASEFLYRELLERQGAAFGMVDGDERFLVVNPVAEQIFGLAPGQLLGRSLWDFISAEQGEVVRRESQLRAQGIASTYELEIRRPDGTRRTLLVTATPRPLREGEPPQVIGVFRDITEQKELEARLRESEETFRTYIEQSRDVIFSLDAQVRFLFASPAWERHFGFPVSEILGRPFAPFVHPDDVHQCMEYLLRVLASHQPETSPPYRVQTAAGEWRWFVANGAALLWRDGSVRFIGVGRDITERIEAEAALKASEARYRDQFNMASEGIYTLSPEGELIEVNASSARMHGYTIQEMQGLTQEALAAPESTGLAQKRMQRLLAGEPVTYQTEHLHKAGHAFPVEVSASLISEGGESRILVFHRDISARRRTEQALLESESRFRSYVENAPVGVFICDEKGRYLQVNQAATAITGYSREELVSFSIADLIPAEWRAFAMGSFQGLAETGHAVTEVGFKHKDGHIGHWRVEAVRLSDTRFLGFTLDITGRRQAEESLRESENQLRVIFEASEAGIALLSPMGMIEFANRRAAEMFGLTIPQLIGTRYSDHLHESEKLAADVQMGMLVDGVIPMVSLERRYVRADGTDFWGHLSGRRLENPDGSLRALVGIVTDISKRREAEEEQRRLHAQLHQAQKMESLGALAGGVAHDMNNVLGAILGLASAHIEAQPQGSPVRQAFGTIIKAAERGGNLLKSLLSFARQSSSEVKDLDLNTVLREEVRLLERTTLSKVRLVMELAEDLRPIRGDAGALTHAFMNLCVNAVDAMPDNGTLTLRTRNLDKGWVEVQVQDTGTGMTKEVLERALDPFFTTKDVGKGTGLGLPMVYSTVKAYQGEMELRSEPGLGTCVVMRFPACEAAPRSMEASGAYRILTSKGSLAVLLVDDDELIQNSMLGMLEMLGHVPTLATSGEEALTRLEAGLHPDVIILDMNMPGLGGAGTLPRIRALHATVPVLLATGRADQTAQDLIHRHRHVTLISKPFGMQELQVYMDAFLS